MKKYLSGSLLALFAIVMFAGCGNLEKRLPKKDGTWALETEHRLEIVDENVLVDSTNTNLGTLVFNKDGSGQKLFTTDTTSIEWAYNSTTDQVTILQNNINFVYNILENDKDAQSWQNIAEIEVGGSVGRVETTWSLKRQ